MCSRCTEWRYWRANKNIAQLKMLMNLLTKNWSSYGMELRILTENRIVFDREHKLQNAIFHSKRKWWWWWTVIATKNIDSFKRIVFAHTHAQNMLHIKSNNYNIIRYNSNGLANNRRSEPIEIFLSMVPFLLLLFGSTLFAFAQLFALKRWFSAWKRREWQPNRANLFSYFVYLKSCAPLEMFVSFFCAFFCVRLFFCGQLLNISHPPLLWSGKSKWTNWMKKKQEHQKYIVQIYMTATIIIHAFNM